MEQPPQPQRTGSHILLAAFDWRRNTPATKPMIGRGNEQGVSSRDEMLVAPPASSFPAYPASWYLFGNANELRHGPLSKRILGRDLVAFSTASGQLAVLDARCSHLGANLGCGRVVGESIQCPFHNWQYGVNGHCTGIPGPSQIPPFARQASYPTVKRHGYLFFFNGPEPLFPLPFFWGEIPEEFAAGRLFRFTADCPWYVTTAHGYDAQHFDAVHDRRLLAPPEIDCPAPYARRNRYHAEVLGRTRLDRWLKTFAGSRVEITITTWGGTFVLITGDFERASSRFIMATQPLENGHTLCEGIVFTRQNRLPVVGIVVDYLTLAVRRYFTHGYLADEANRLRQTRYNPSALIKADQAMVEYFQWLAALPQSKSRKVSHPIHPAPENDPRCERATSLL